MVACSIGCLLLQVVRCDSSTLAHCDAVRGEDSPPLVKLGLSVFAVGLRCLMSLFEVATRGDGVRRQMSSLRHARGHHARSTTAVLRCRPALRPIAAADGAGGPCGPPSISCLYGRGTARPCVLAKAVDDDSDEELASAALDQVATIFTRCASKRVPSRSIAQATLSRRSATERRARACPWPRARSDRYLSWLTGSRWAAIRAQW